MANHEKDPEYPTRTVMGSKVVGRADGRVAIVLQTKEQGAIALEVNLEQIEILRKALVDAERFLRTPAGKA